MANSSGSDGWEMKNWNEVCSSIIDTGFNGWGLRSFARLRKFLEYMRSFRDTTNMMKAGAKVSKFAYANHQWRDSGASTVIPIWVNGIFRPARVRLIRGEAALLLGMHIVKEFGAQVDFGSDQFKVGQGEWEMVTFNEKAPFWYFAIPQLLLLTLN